MATCKCSGGYRVNGEKWVVLLIREGMSSRLKCLACGWKWWSKAKYVRTLREHKERSRSGMSDEDILHRIVAGTLQVSPCGTEVVSVHRGNPKTLTILTHRGGNGNGSTYRFVTVCHNGRKKKIAIHRLVWMSVNLQVVPDGFNVDHIKGKGIQFPDSIDNLRLLESLEHQRLHNEPQSNGFPF